MPGWEQIDAALNAAAPPAAEPVRETLSGPENYAHAHMLLDMAADAETGSDHEAYFLAKASVHAVLADAAARALQTAEGVPPADYRAWVDVAAVKVTARHKRPDDYVSPLAEEQDAHQPLDSEH